MLDTATRMVGDGLRRGKRAADHGVKATQNWWVGSAAKTWDQRHLARTRSDLVPTDRELAIATDELRDRYTSYTATVSEYGMPASLEAAAVLLVLCRKVAPRRLADLGSGFSSFVLRLYASQADADVEVVSVDDSVEWLERTKEFLPDDMRFGGFETWEEFRRRTETDRDRAFDIVFHDLAGGALREDAMPVALRACAPGGLVIFDDAHHRGHRRRMSRESKASGAELVGLGWCTLDRVGRYAKLAILPTA